jgi:hypothetical protein
MRLKAISGITLSLLFMGIVASTFNVAFAQPPTTEWTKTYGGTGMDEANSVVQTSDGGYALAGFTYSFGAGGDDFWLVKTDGSGNMQWNKTYGGTGMDEAHSVVQTSDGGYALAGDNSYDFWLVKTDSFGNTQWNKTYGGWAFDEAWSVVQTSDGGYALAGSTWSYGAGKTDFWLVKVDSSGNMQWSKSYGGADLDEAYSVVQTSDGGYAIAGYTASFGAGLADFWLVKTDGSGNMQWNKTYGGTKADQAFSVVQTFDGGYALGGSTFSYGKGQNDFWLVKVDSSGNMQWNKTYGGTSCDEAHSVVQTSDGGYALAGSTESFGTYSIAFWLVKVDSSGNAEWNKTVGEATDADEAYCVVKTSDGGYALAGVKAGDYGMGNYDFYLAKVARPQPQPSPPPPPSVGGKATPINIPTNKPELPTVWIWLTILLPLAATTILVKLKKKKQ